MDKQSYNPEQNNFILKEHDVHIWVVDMDKITVENKNILKDILSKEESERATKFNFDIDRDRFICGTGLLRLILSSYTNISPEIISFNYSKYGKPEISGEQNKNEIHFNLSNSQSMLCVGLVKNESIGVDIEIIKPIKDYFDVANKFFSDQEITQLKTFPGEKSLEAFYSCWTAKESFIKLSGEGLSYPLKEFVVQINELKIEETFRYKIQVNNSEQKFFIESFKIQNDFVGACALNNNLFQTVYTVFDESSYSINQFINNNLT